MPKLFSILRKMAGFAVESSGNEVLAVKPGDLHIRQEGATWTAIKILAVDPWPDGTAVAHCLTYEASSTEPTADTLGRSGVRIWHAPIESSTALSAT